jgi:hypothetical protein
VQGRQQQQAGSSVMVLGQYTSGEYRGGLEDCRGTELSRAKACSGGMWQMREIGVGC